MSLFTGRLCLLWSNSCFLCTCTAVPLGLVGFRLHRTNFQPTFLKIDSFLFLPLNIHSRMCFEVHFCTLHFPPFLSVLCRKLWIFFSLSLSVSQSFLIYCNFSIYLRHPVAQLVEPLRYKREGRGFDCRWFHWIFSLT